MHVKGAEEQSTVYTDNRAQSEANDKHTSTVREAAGKARRAAAARRAPSGTTARNGKETDSKGKGTEQRKAQLLLTVRSKE